MFFSEATSSQKFELVTYLMERFNAEFASESESEEHEALTFKVKFEDGREQIVFATLTPKYLTFWSPFAADFDKVSAEQALAAAAEMQIGVYAVGGLYSVIHKLPWITYTLSAVDVAIAMVAETADDLEKEIFSNDRF